MGRVFRNTLPSVSLSATNEDKKPVSKSLSPQLWVFYRDFLNLLELSFFNSSVCIAVSLLSLQSV